MNLFAGPKEISSPGEKQQKYSSEDNAERIKIVGAECAVKDKSVLRSFEVGSFDE